MKAVHIYDDYTQERLQQIEDKISERCQYYIDRLQHCDTIAEASRIASERMHDTLLEHLEVQKSQILANAASKVILVAEDHEDLRSLMNRFDVP